jgi:hypothetical protein
MTTTFSPPIPLTAESAQGTSVFGITTFYPFTTKISDPDSFTHFTILSQGTHLTFPVQTSAFVVPSLTTVSSTTTTALNFTIATKSSGGWRLGRRSTTPTVKVQVPVGQQGTLGPAIKMFDSVAVTTAGNKAGYELWAGAVDVGALRTGALSVTILDEEGKDVDVAFF